MIQHAPRSSSKQLWTKPVALLLVGSMTLPTLAGCGGQATPPPPADATIGQAPMRPSTQGSRNSMQGARQGMSGKQKLVLLAGAAAIYYFYKKHKNSQNQAVDANAQYYMSKNGRVYYREPKTHRAIWVTAPTQPIQIPENEASEYQQFQGYNNSTSGKSKFDGLIPTGPGM